MAPTELIGRPFYVAGSLLACLVVLVALLELNDAFNRGSGIGGLEAASAAIATAVGCLCVMRWRQAGDAPALWIGAGVMVFGLCTIGLTGLESVTDAWVMETSVVSWLRPASVLITVALLAYALISPEVDARLGLWPVLAIAFGSVAGLTVVLQFLPGVAVLVASGADALPYPSTFVGGVLVVLLLSGLAVVYLRRGLARDRLLFAWLGLALTVLAAAEIGRSLVGLTGHAWVAGGALLRTCGLLVALTGAVRELQETHRDQSRRLLETRLQNLSSEARLRADLKAQEERAHEARNALAAIEGATLTLERYRDTLAPATRATLTEAISGEIARLQRLVSAEQVASSGVTFRLADVVESQLALARARGSRVLAHLPEDLFAVGRPADVAEVLQNLLINAQRHGRDAASSPIVVRAAIEGEEVVVRVEDRGPGIPVQSRARIFERGVRGANGTRGSGLGLFVSRHLMEQQHGRLWVEDRSGGGACFTFSLPTAWPNASSAGPQLALATDSRDQVG